MINGLGVTRRQIFLQCPVQQHLRRTWGWRWESWWLRLVVCVSAAFPSRWATKGRFPSWVHIQGESPPWNSVFREGLDFQEMMSLLAKWGEFLGWCRMVLHVLLWAKFVQLGGLTPILQKQQEFAVGSADTPGKYQKWFVPSGCKGRVFFRYGDSGGEMTAFYCEIAWEDCVESLLPNFVYLQLSWSILPNSQTTEQSRRDSGQTRNSLPLATRPPASSVRGQGAWVQSRELARKVAARKAAERPVAIGSIWALEVFGQVLNVVEKLTQGCFVLWNSQMIPGRISYGDLL